MNFSVTQNGKKLNKDKYTWDENTRTFSTAENNLVLDFSKYNYYTFKTGSNCTFNTGYGCTFDTGEGCTFNTDWNCTFNTDSYCTFNTGSNCTFSTGYRCTFNTSFRCTFNTGFGCTFETGWNCTFNTGSGCTFNTGYDCTFNTGYDCTFDTSDGCTFNTGYGCTFDTSDDCTFDTSDCCTFNTGYGCTFNTGSGCVIVRRDVFEVIQPKVGTIYKLCPWKIKGYLTKKEGENAFYMDIDCKRVEHIIADGILSKVVKKKGNVYHVINHGQEKETFLIKDGEIYSHGDTLEQARESLKYKIADRDTTEFEKYKLDDKLDLTTLIRAYRVITGACEAGTRYFCENNTLPEKMTVAKAIELTQGQYNHDLFRKFFEEINHEL